MSGWILLVVALYVVQTFLPSAARARTRLPEQIRYLRGNRDTAPPAPKMAGRLARAQKNMEEALFVFVPLALMLWVRDPGAAGATGAVALFFWARVAYVPAYMSGIPLLRTGVWTVGHGALGAMAWMLAH